MTFHKSVICNAECDEGWSLKFCRLTTNRKQTNNGRDRHSPHKKSKNISEYLDMFFVQFLFLSSLVESRPHTGSVSTLVKAGPRSVPMSPTHLSLSRSETDRSEAEEDYQFAINHPHFQPQFCISGRT